jgi:hypothetical protein
MIPYLKQFFLFLRYCNDVREPIPNSVDQMDWDRLFRFCTEQALLGISYKGIERLSIEGIRPQKKTLLTWYAAYEAIVERNCLLGKKTIKIIEDFRKGGFCCVVLKGQGNALMYPYPQARTSGDVDIWVKSNKQKAKRKDVIRFVRSRFKVINVRYHHVEFVEDGITIEAHYVPLMMNNPFYNNRLQRWLKDSFESEPVNLNGLGKVELPTDESNLVYQLAHMMHHFFDEGLGLRQVMDYFFLIHNPQFMEYDYQDTLEYLGLKKFAGALMWVEHEVFGLEERYLIVPANEWRGRTLLDEILKGGNFGQYSGLTKRGMVAKYFLKIRRNMRFVLQYPAEALCEPFFRTWHFFWRIKYKKIC